MYRLAVIAAAVALSLVIGVSASSQVGGESGAYLRYPVGASALAMGGANTADPSYLAPWWNPAVLAQSKARSSSFGAGFRSLGQTDGFASLEFRVPPRVGMGFLLLYRGDPLLTDLHDINENRVASAAYTTFTGKIALSYYVTRKLALGTNLAIHYQQLPNDFFNGSVIYASSTSIGSFDFALAYAWSKHLDLAVVLKNVGTTMTWNLSSADSYDYSLPVDDRVLPSLLLGSALQRTLYGKPLLWKLDMRCSVFDGSWKRLGRPEVALSTGLDWRYWQMVSLRAGVGDLLLNGDIVSDSREYGRTFSCRITAGAAFDLSRMHSGLVCNYGVSTDKVWAGIDQQLDITYTF